MMMPVMQTNQDGLLAFLDSLEGTAITSEPDDTISSDVFALPPEKFQNERQRGCKKAKRQRLSEAGEADAAMTEGAAGMRAMAEAAKEIVKIQKESLKLEKKKYILGTLFQRRNASRETNLLSAEERCSAEGT
jgi:CRISPR/Cas system CMR-associated protein Cmr1 (group 7 of RAMP superfamily)